MSTTVDQRVVEMQFDNRHFEQNVSQTMSTLDRLKQKLHLPGASKGLEDVGAAAKKADMSPLAKGVEDVRMKFSALDVMAVTALSNITNSAVNAGKRIVKALALDPITTGLSEYETQINATQTILANTQSKGTTIDDVNVALKQLNDYADKTIYNFTEMTRNIGTFTAAGVDLDTSVSAIQGIANLAAVSGSTSQQASTAMYQLSQALATDTVRLQDWNSVVNAGMGGEVFQDALVRTAAVMAGASEDVEGWRKKNIESYGSFRDSLTRGEWLTTDVLTATLNQFTMAAEEGSDEWEKFKKSLMETGYTEKQAEEILKMANTATDAATKVKTFTQLWDVLKEAAQSGWAQSWKIIIGDFEQAKNLLSPLADFLTGVINKISDVRNAILESALTKGLGKISDSIKTILKPAKKAVEVVNKVTDSLEDLDAIAKTVIRGDWGNGEVRFNGLAEAGYNYCEVQNKVNEMLGCSVRYSQEQIDAQNELLGKQKKTTKQAEEQAKATEDQAEAEIKLDDEQKKRLKTLLKMSEAELKAAGLSKTQIEALKELGKMAKKLGLSTDEFIDNLDKINGRWLLIEGFKNIGQGLIGIFKAMGQAWLKVFPSTSVKNISDGLFNLIAAFHRLTAKINLVDKDGNLTKTGEKWRRTFAGVFAILDIITTLTAGPLKIAFKLVTKVLDLFGLSILDVTAVIGDVLVKISEWVDGLFDVEKIVNGIIDAFKNAPAAIKNLWKSFKNSKIIQAALPLFQALKDAIVGLIDSVKQTKAFAKVAEFFKPFLDGIKSWWAGLKEAENIPKYLLQGLWNGIKNGASKLWGTIENVIVNLIEIVKDVLDIHSPSGVFMAIGGFIVAGLLIGLTNAFPGVWDAVGGFVENLFAIVGKVDWGTILAGVISSTTVAALYNFMKFLTSVGTMFEGVGDVLEGAGKVLKKSARAIKKVVNSFSKVLNGVALDLKAGAIKKFAIAIAILVGCIAALALVVHFLDPKELWTAVGIIGGLIILLGVFAVVMEKMSQSSAKVGKDGLAIEGLNTVIIQIGVTMLLLAVVMKIMSGISWGDFAKGALLMAALGGLIAGLMAASRLAGSDPLKSAMNIAKISALIKAVGTTFLLLAITAKIIGSMSGSELKKAGGIIASFGGVIAGLFLVTKFAGKDLDKAAMVIAKVGIAFLALALTAKLIAGMEPDAIKKGFAGVVALSGVIVGLIAATKLAGGKKQLTTVGSTIAAVGGAIALLAISAKIMGTMSWDELEKAGKGILALGGVVVGLIAATKLAGKSSKHMAKTLLGVAGAIAIMAVIVMVLGMIKPEILKRGIICVGLLGAMMVGLIWVTSKAKSVNKTITSLAILIGVLAAALIALSFIPSDRILPAVLSLVGVMVALSVVLRATEKMKNSKYAMPIMLSMAAVFAVLGTTLILLAHTPWQQSLAAAGAMTTVLIALSVAFKIIGDSKNIKQLPQQMAMIALIIAVLGAAVYLIATQPWGQALAAAGAMTTVLVALAVAFKIIGDSKNITQTLPIMGAMALIIGVLGGVIFLIAQQPWQQALAAAGAMTTVLIAMAVAFNILGNSKKIKQTLPIILTMGLVMGVLGVVLSLIAKQPWSNALAAAASMAIVILALAGSMKLLSQIKSISGTTIATLLLMTVAIGIIGVVISLVGGLGGSAAMTAMISIAGVLVVLAVALNYMNGTIAGSAALVVASAALIIMAGAFVLLGTLSIAQIVASLIAIAGALVIVGVAGAVLTPYIAVIMLLATAIMLIGTAILAVGGGFALMGIGTRILVDAFIALGATMSTTIPQIVDGMTKLTVGVLALIPIITKGVGDGLIALCEVIIATTPSVVQAILALIQGAADAAVGSIPILVQAGFDMMIGFLQGIANGIPRVIQAAFEVVLAFINGLADGIRNNTEKVTAAVRNLMDAIMEAVRSVFGEMVGLGGNLTAGLGKGIGGGIGGVLSVVTNLGSKIIGGIKKLFGIHSPSTVFAGIGKNLVQGLCNGIKNIIPNAIAAVKKLGQSVLNAICKVLGINSPSKEFMKIGEFSGQGFAEGLLNSSGTVNTAASGVASGALDSFRSIFEGGKGSVNLGDLINPDSTLPPGLVLNTSGMVEGMGYGFEGEQVEKLQEIINTAREKAGLDTMDITGKWDETMSDYYKWFEKETLKLDPDGVFKVEDKEAIEKYLDDLDWLNNINNPMSREEHDTTVKARSEARGKILDGVTSLGEYGSAEEARAAIDSMWQAHNDIVHARDEIWGAIEDANNDAKFAKDARDYWNRDDLNKLYKSGYTDDGQAGLVVDGQVLTAEQFREYVQAQREYWKDKVTETEQAQRDAYGAWNNAKKDLNQKYGITDFSQQNLTNVASGYFKKATEQGTELNTEGYKDWYALIDEYLTPAILDRYNNATPEIQATVNDAIRAGIEDASKDGSITEDEIASIITDVDTSLLQDSARQYSDEFMLFLKQYMEENHPEIDMKNVSFDQLFNILSANGEMAKLMSKWEASGLYTAEGYVAGFEAYILAHQDSMVGKVTAVEALVREALGIHSPSVVFTELGMYTAQGFIEGFGKHASNIPGVVKEVTDGILKLFTGFDPDADIQPTITPVLDLSNVNRDAPWLTGGTHTVDLALATAGVNSANISTMMNQRGQNGNEDVVSAIDKLGAGLHDDITGIDANVYNICGITYNDENAITEAIKLIVRQMIRKERT